VTFDESKKNMQSILEIIENKLVKSVHDCSKGGLAVAVSELCMTNNIGCSVFLNKVPGESLPVDKILFSESHSRYLLSVEKNNLDDLKTILEKNYTSFEIIGNFGGNSILFSNDSKPVIDLMVDKTQKTWLNSLEGLIMHA
jgi:phosphoribosylformylglycinamidine synthase